MVFLGKQFHVADRQRRLWREEEPIRIGTRVLSACLENGPIHSKDTESRSRDESIAKKAVRTGFAVPQS